MDNRFSLLEKEIIKILPKSPLIFELKHAQLTLKWLLRLNPDADEALRISALAHDIERAITGITEKDLKEYSGINQFKKEHAKRSAKIVINMMKKYHYGKHNLEKVKRLIESHEVGGNKEQNILMEADSLAYFDYNVPHYFRRYGDKRTKEKIQFMYKRLSNKAQCLVRKIKFNKKVKALFECAISEL
ncbi:MAG TPA: DUF4202 family protein [Candidatus Moranbacteria bacterium]|nr:DUF4202 family protein [Candidatus Moranbacteria bacterium]